MSVSRELRRMVWERDGGVCGICTLPVPFDRAMHADHIVLKVTGGPDTLDNLRATHRACNLRRCDDGRRRGVPRARRHERPVFRIRLPEDVHAEITRIAASRERTLTGQIIWFLREGIAREKERAPNRDADDPPRT